MSKTVLSTFPLIFLLTVGLLQFFSDCTMDRQCLQHKWLSQKKGRFEPHDYEKVVIFYFMIKIQRILFCNN